MAKRIEELIRSRKEKLEELRSLGVNPYPQTVNKKHTAQQAKMKMDKSVSVAGRIRGLRGHGAIAFVDLEDESGRIQLFFNKKDFEKKQVKILEVVDTGDFIEANGRIFKTEAGEITVRVRTFRLLSKSIRPLPSTWYGFKDVEERYRRRYVDFIMNPDSKKVIELRSKIVSAVRNILEKKGFLEIETPTLQSIYGGANARPFTTYYNALKQDFYLKISDELYLKRLIIGGFEKVFEIDHDFRNEGIDATHNPEFTMMECYWAYADYNDMMRLTEEIYSKVAKKVLGTTKVEYDGHKIDLKAPWKRMTMKGAIKKYLKINVDRLSDNRLKEELIKRKLKIGTRGNKYNRGLSIASLFEVVEEELIQPIFITDFPKETTSLCKLHRDDSALIERFEPYIAGSEVGNAYTELNDPDLQRHFFEEEAKAKEGGDEEAHPLDEDFLSAMEYGMPPTGGLGLGIDRMAMIMTGTSSIRDIIAFPTLKKRRTKIKTKK